MTDAEQREAARQFINRWMGKGKEDEDGRSYWIDLLTSVLGMDNITERLNFEKKVVVDGNTKRIDVYIPETSVIIEQKSLGKALDQKIRNSGEIDLTPFEQADRYNSKLTFDERARWIVTSNFAEIWIYDMNQKQPEPTKIALDELQSKYPLLDFLVKKEVKKISHEMEVSIKAGDIVGLIYDAFLNQYRIPDIKEKDETAEQRKKREHKLKSLNALCVRIVFCLYAEDACIFGKRNMFHDYLEAYEVKDCRRALIELFKTLDTPVAERDEYLEEDLARFPYVNGGLFADETVEIPPFTEEIRQLLLIKASENFNWSDISPTIFGAVFESTLNPETRRSGGMHYTSIENIHKVIDPLFLDGIKNEFSEIQKIRVKRTKDKMLDEFQNKMASIAFFDPACGSGNFLTETYLSLRRLENEVIREKVDGQMTLGEVHNPIKVSIQQFYGIEINDFAVTVAKTALWIAESQMLEETKSIVYGFNDDFLPLKTYVNITEGNALRINWNDVIPAGKLSYIMGNPPFVGQAMRSTKQADDMQKVFYPSKAGGKLDYVGAWFKKASDFMKNTKIEAAFVSSNSICQGESVNLLWELLLTNGIVINFAHTTFKWISEAKNQAAVMCVIVGFSYHERKTKKLFVDEDEKKVPHINGYLNAAPDVFIKNRSKSINKGLAKVVQGSPPADNGRLMLNREERERLLQKYPRLNKVIKPFLGSREFLNDIECSRYCFWFVGENPADYTGIPELIERFDYIREYRQNSPVDRIQKTADQPWLFTQNRQPLTDYILIPRHSSGERRYIPMGFMSPNIICSDAVVLVDHASLYDFGILSSNIHNAWMRTVCGRLKADYRYAPSVYYNFPMPEMTEDSKEAIEKTAENILNMRKIYSKKTLADLYGKQSYLYPELQKAHRNNDCAVMRAYGFSIRDMSEVDCIAELMKLYQKKIQEN